MNNQNFGLVLARQSKEDFAARITNHVCTHKIVTVYVRSFLFPLYLYPETSIQQSFTEQPKRTPNFNIAIVEKIADSVNDVFLEDVNTMCDLQTSKEGTFSPLDLLDYIYAVLHSPTYREKYKKFLKIDFPRVPYLKDAATFWKLLALGGEIRSVHLLESPVVSKYIT